MLLGYSWLRESPGYEDRKVNLKLRKDNLDAFMSQERAIIFWEDAIGSKWFLKRSHLALF